MRFISTTLVLSLIAISLSTNAREVAIFGGFNHLETETTESTNAGETEGTSTELDTVTLGSRTGFGAFIQSFEDDGFYFGAAFQRAEGYYDLCADDDRIGMSIRIADVNVELGWFRHQRTPLLDISWSNTEPQVPAAIDTETDLDFGIGSWYRFAKDTNVKIKVCGLRNNYSETITAGFQRKLQTNFSIDESFAYPITQDVTGFGFRFASGWTL